MTIADQGDGQPCLQFAQEASLGAHVTLVGSGESHKDIPSSKGERAASSDAEHRDRGVNPQGGVVFGLPANHGAKSGLCDVHADAAGAGGNGTLHLGVKIFLKDTGGLPEEGVAPVIPSSLAASYSHNLGVHIAGSRLREGDRGVIRVLTEVGNADIDVGKSTFIFEVSNDIHTPPKVSADGNLLTSIGGDLAAACKESTDNRGVAVGSDVLVGFAGQVVCRVVQLGASTQATGADADSVGLTAALPRAVTQSKAAKGIPDLVIGHLHSRGMREGIQPGTAQRGGGLQEEELA